MKIFERRDALVAAIATMTLAGCGSDGASDGGQASKHSVGIAVSGLAGSGLTLADNGGDLLQTLAGYSVDSNGGTFTAINGTPFTVLNSSGLDTMALDPAGRFLYMTTADAIYAFSIDSTTGAVTSVAGSPFTVALSPAALSVGGLTIDPSSRFIYLPSAPNLSASGLLYVLRIDPVTGALTAVPGSPFATGSASQAIAFRY